ncbi:MAG: phosphopantothenate/pantothenate synthetase [Candidatus Pacebacteria bacterium]|nr:phosphopantothenate/pantothenate synthetase [Candidatus Paceibacterota bacterium]
MTDIPRLHPRYASLVAREKIVVGINKGLTSQQGLIAQGRGECFDYFVGEKTTASAQEATKIAAAMLLTAGQAVISVNGNVAALAASEVADLANSLDIPLEVNLFHRSEERVKKIADHLRAAGAKKVIGETPNAKIPGLEHARALATKGGIYDADAVLIPLEDGDRCEALLAMGKKVIAIDLNPFSRTAQKATVSIVDNLLRAIPNLAAQVKELSTKPRPVLEELVGQYDNKEILAAAVREIQSHFDKEAAK